MRLPTGGYTLMMRVAVLCCLAVHQVATAGAWVQQEGETMALLGIEAIEANSYFDEAGNAVSMGRGKFQRRRASAYWEYGATPQLTAFGQIDAMRAWKTDGMHGTGQSNSGIGEYLIGLRRSTVPYRAVDHAAYAASLQFSSSTKPTQIGDGARHIGFGYDYAYALSNLSWLHSGAELRLAQGGGAQLQLRSEYLGDAGAAKQWTVGVEQRMSLHHGAATLDADRTQLHARLTGPVTDDSRGLRRWQIGIEKDIAGRNTLRALSISLGAHVYW